MSIAVATFIVPLPSKSKALTEPCLAAAGVIHAGTETDEKGLIPMRWAQMPSFMWIHGNKDNTDFL